MTRNVDRGVAVDQRLTISRAGFIYRGGLLWNQLSDIQRQERNTGKFKRDVRKWVELKVSSNQNETRMIKISACLEQSKPLVISCKNGYAKV